MKPEVEEAYMKFQNEEAVWLDSVVRPMLPRWLTSIVEGMNRTRGLTLPARLLHFLVDYVLIARVLRVRIVRNQDMSILEGKGFRTPRQRLDSVRTKVSKGGVEVAEKKFLIGVIIN